jgi:hypothetical protein
MAMRTCGCNDNCIAQCSMSRATLEASGCCYWASTPSVLPRQLPGQQETLKQRNNATTLLAVFMAIQCASTLSCASPDRGDPGLH